MSPIDHLLDIARRCGVTREELAVEAGVSLRTIVRWRTPLGVAEARQVRALRNALGNRLNVRIVALADLYDEAQAVEPELRPAMIPLERAS